MNVPPFSRNLEALHAQRQEILQHIAVLPPFRRGTVTEHRRTCGKPNCKCQRSTTERHGGYQWTASIGGHKFQKHLHLGPEVDLVLQQTDTYRTFESLMQKYIEVTEQIAQQASLPTPASEDELEALKIKLRKRLSMRRNRTFAT
jgi:hypothetical protein